VGSFQAEANSGQTELSGATAKAPLALATSESRASRRSWTIVLAAGVVAALLAWLAGELAHQYFRPRKYSSQVMGVTSMQPSRESQKAAELANATLASAVLGAVTALTMGLAGGLAGRAPGRGAIVGLGAAALGAFAGAAASWALIPVFFRQLVPDWNDLLTPILIHGGIWAPIGAVGGLAFAAGMGIWRRVLAAVLAGCVSAFAASFVFHVLTGILFPHSSALEAVVGSPAIRVIAISLVTILTAIGAAQGTLGRLHRRSNPVPVH
jgi:hypothetical protein